MQVTADLESARLNTAGEVRSPGLDQGRRAFFRSTGLAVAGASVLTSGRAFAQSAPPTDTQILNFALNLEYLEGEYYFRAANGVGLPDADTGGQGTPGPVSGGSKVPFSDPNVAAYANEIANDELAHVRFIRSALSGSAVARPAIDLDGAFTTAALAAGVIGPGQTFNPFVDDVSFLLGAYLLSDVGVTAYQGAAPLITDKTVLTAAAGILATEAYHTGLIHTTLFAKQQQDPSRMIFRNTRLISARRSSLSMPANALPDDQGISANESQIDGGPRTLSNIVPTDANSVAFPRTPRQVLNVVYGAPNAVAGLFFPNGINPGP